MKFRQGDKVRVCKEGYTSNLRNIPVGTLGTIAKIQCWNKLYPYKVWCPIVDMMGHFSAEGLEVA